VAASAPKPMARPDADRALAESPRPWIAVHRQFLADLEARTSEREGVEPQELARRSRAHLWHVVFWGLFFVVLTFVAMFGLIAEF